MSKKYSRPLPQFADHEIHLLRVFHAVARAGGFSAAQIELNASQPTISKQMGQLEARLGLRLCERGRSGFRLTADGEEVFESAQRLFEALSGFRHDVGRLQGEVTGDLNVGTLDAVVFHKATPLWEELGKFNRKYPAIRLHLKTDSPQGLTRGLMNGRYDIVFSVFLRNLSDVQKVPLHSGRQILCCGQGHMLFEADPEEISLEDLKGQQFVSRPFMTRLHPDLDLPVEDVATSADMEGVAGLIRTGRFIGYLPEYFAEYWIRKQQMKIILEHQLSYEVTLETAIKSNNTSDAAAKLFKAFERLQA